MPGRVLLDTNIVLALFAQDMSVFRQLAAREVFVPRTVLGELYYGARKSAQTSANLARIDQFAQAIEVLSCDAITAQHFGQIKNRLRSRNYPIPDDDIWIAAVALQYGLPLATRDEHFQAVDGLILEKW